MKKIKIFLLVMCAIILCGCTKSQEQFSKEITNVVKQYNNGDISYDEASSELSSMYNNADSEMKTKIDDEQALLEIRITKRHNRQLWMMVISIWKKYIN